MGGLEVTGIILAGGKSSRMKRNKAFLDISNEKIIRHISSQLQKICSSLIIVTNTPEEYVNLEIPVVQDIMPHQGPLGGLHSGLIHSKHYYNLVVACDMPFVNANLAVYFLDQASGFDAVIPRIKGLPQPLFAVYAKSCIESIEECLNSGVRKISKLYQYLNVFWVEEAVLQEIAKPEVVFFNINTPQDWEAAKEMVK